MLGRSVRFGLIGTGEVMMERHIPALQQIAGARVRSVLSRTLSRAEEVTKRFGARSFDNLDMMLKDPDLDAVLIATPDALHAQTAIAAAHAGKHVFVEKPMATSIEDGRRIISACSDNRVRLAVGYHLRFHAGHRSLKNAIAEGVIGAPRDVKIEWSYKAPPNDWRKDRAHSPWWALAAVGTHAIDLASFLTSSLHVTNSVTWLRADEGENEHTASALITFDERVEVEVFVSNRVKLPRRITIEGSTGRVRCEATLGAYGKGEVFINDVPLSFEAVDPYEMQLREFVQAIRDDRDPEVGAEVGLKNLESLVEISKNVTSTVTNGAVR